MTKTKKTKTAKKPEVAPKTAKKPKGKRPKGKPSRIYSYGASAPVENLDMACDQIKLYHRHRNRIVDLERTRRDKVNAATASLSPELAAVLAELSTVEKKLEETRREKSKGNSAARARHEDPETDPLILSLRARRKALYTQRKSLQGAVFKTPEWKPLEKEIEDWFAPTSKALRDQSQLTGGPWGTLGALEESCRKIRKGPPPKFHHWDGRGKVAVQLQGGLPVADAFAGTDSQLRIELTPEKRRYTRPNGEVRIIREGVFVEGKLQKKKLGDAILRIRINSDGRKPVWCCVPFYYHRELPAGASIKWAWVIRRRLGTHDQWFVQFTLSKESKEEWRKKDSAATGSVGIDIGWRVMDDGALRVASWVGSDGRSGTLTLPLAPQTSKSLKREQLKFADSLGCYTSAASGEPMPLTTRPRTWLNGMLQTENIRSIRDRHLNEMQEPLVAWIKERGKNLPAWFVDTISSKKQVKFAKEEGRKPPTTIYHWRSAARFASLALLWRKNRFDGDEEAFTALENWRMRDKHLYEYEANLRDRLQGQRTSIYRNFAAFMRRNYAIAVIEGRPSDEEDSDLPMDLREFHELPMPEDKPGALGEKGSRAKEHVRDACLSSLRTFLKESMTVTTRPAPKTTCVCNKCGSHEIWDQVELMHTCSGCGENWDQDENAARNLLTGTPAASAAEASET